jgi:hypothetical protein
MQTKAFMDGDDSLFCSADEQLQHCAIYDRMAGLGPGLQMVPEK